MPLNIAKLAKIKTPASRMNLPNQIIVLSHLRWDFVYQRPQHLLTRFAADHKIFFIEEPLYNDISDAYYEILKTPDNVVRIVPHLPHGLSAEEIILLQKSLLDGFMRNKQIDDFAFWYYTPMALEFSRHLHPSVVIFDCMDELSAFKFAPANLKALEQELLKKADVVFTGGNSLYEAKKHQHSNMHPFPSSIEAKHFSKARIVRKNANEQPTLGFYGVIDERFDIKLIKGIADARPDWKIVLVGPVVKIDPATLPKNSNIVYAGPKSYQELPSCMAEWDIALIPFVLNDSTKFISPTKTPEYLAAGLPVISTPITDVVKPYGINKLVHIGRNASDFVDAAELELNKSTEQKAKWLAKTDAFLALNSWDKTYQQMLLHIKDVAVNRLKTPMAQ
jgi:glycosyltransferase involved in cell wall biosynthesis